MIANIDDNHWIWFNHITESEEDVLWVEFSVVRPGIYIDPAQRGNWDGIYRKYNRAKQRMARPLLSMLRGVCQKNNLPLTVVDRRKPWPYQVMKPEEITTDFMPGITLDDWQVRAIQRGTQVECGIFDVPTGGGKGELIAGLCKAIQCPTVVLAEQRVVIDQLKERLELRDVADEVGIFYAGKRPNGELVVVGSIQSLTPPSKPPLVPQKRLKETDAAFDRRMKKWDIAFKAYKTRRANAKVLQEYVRKAEMLIVDECVHEDTFIATDVGLERAALVLDRLRNGETVAARVNNQYHKITAWAEKTEDTVNVTTETGIILRSSHRHPCAVLVDGRCEYKHAVDLNPGDLLLAPRPTIISTTIEDSWYHLGLFIGDGHFLDEKRVRFAVRKDVDDWRAVGLSMSAAWRGSFKSGFNRRGDFVFVIESPALVEWLRRLGFKPGRKIGSIDPRFSIPSTDAAASLLRGLFDAEGSSYKSSITCDSIDWALISFAQKLMAYLGIGSSVFISNKRVQSHHARLWRVAVSGENARLWRQLVGFGFSRKRDKLAVVSNTNSERRIDPQPWFARWRAAGLPASKMAKMFGIGTGEMSPRNRSRVSLAKLVKWQNLVDALAVVVPADYDSAKLLFGVSDAKVAAFAGVDSKTVWNRRQRGDDQIWRDYVRDLQNRLISERVDTDLKGYSVEVVKSVEFAAPARLIDFTVPGPACFEANGLLVHNCDKAVSDPWKNLFRHYFHGRRRYGFCLPGCVTITTTSGTRRLDSFGDGEAVSLLCHLDGRDRFRTGTVVHSGTKECWCVSFSDGTYLLASPDHLVANDRGDYIRVEDIIPGQLVQFKDDCFVQDLVRFVDALGECNTGPDFDQVPWHGLKLTRAKFDGGVEVDDVLSPPIETILYSRILGGELDGVGVEELHEEQLVRRSVIEDPTKSVNIIAGLELGGKFETSGAVSLSDGPADFFTHGWAIDGVAAEFVLQRLQASLDHIGSLEYNGTPVALYHGRLDSINHGLQLHGMIDTIASEAGLPPLFLIVERLTAVPCDFDGHRLFLMLRDGEPIFCAMLAKHFLFIGVQRATSSVYDVRQFLNALWTQMPTELSDLIGWTVNRACVNYGAVVAANRGDVMVSRAAVIPFSLNDRHGLSPLNGASFYYLCQKAARSVAAVRNTGIWLPMFDVVDVADAANFYADNVLVHNSGTPVDPEKPVEAMVMQEHLGSVIFRETREHLTQIGRIIPCEYYSLTFGLDGSIHEASAYDIATNEFIVENEDFHLMVAKLCRKCKREEGDGTLVLVDRELLGHKLVEVIRRLGMTCEFIFGKTAKRRRNEVLRAFERREFDVLIGGKIINRGLDLKGGCENLIIATGGKLQSEFIQKIGRALRHNRRGKSKVYDFFFRCNRYLYSHSKARLKAMLNAGYRTTVVFPGGGIDGAELVQSRFQIRRRLLVPRPRPATAPA